MPRDGVITAMGLLNKGIAEERLKTCEGALAAAFPGGMRRGSMLQVRRLVACYNELGGYHLDPANTMCRTQIEDMAQKAGIVCGEFVFARKALLPDAGREKLHSIMEGYFNKGAPAIYYEALFDVMQEDSRGAFDGGHINTADMLKEYIKAVFPQYGICALFFTQCPRKAGDKVPDTREHIADVLLRLGGGDAVRVEDLAREMPYFTLDYIQGILRADKRFASAGGGEGKVFIASAVELERSELIAIREIIDEGIEKNGCIPIGGVLAKTYEKCPALFERYTFLTSATAFGGALRKILAGEYSFNNAIVSELDKEINNSLIFAQWARDNVPFTLEQLLVHGEEIGINPPMGVVVSNALRVSRDEFVPRDSARFDTDTIDDVIASYCEGEYVTFKAFTGFGAFPSATFADGTRPWNVFLLESYAAGYSKRFRLLGTYPTRSSCTGAIVRKDAPYRTYTDVITDYLAHHLSEIASEKDAIALLHDAGLIGQLRYKDIDKVLAKARTAL